MSFLAGSVGSSLTITPPAGVPVSVNITGGSVYAAGSGGAAITFPQTITSATTYFSQLDQYGLTVSCKVNGMETANGNGGTVGWSAVGGASLTITPSPTAAQLVGGVDLSWSYGYLEPSGALSSTIDGRLSASATTAAMTSGTVYECAIPLDSGVTVSNVSLFVTTAEATGTHAWVGLADNTNKLVAVSADHTAATYFGPIDTVVTTALVSPYTTTYDGLYYVVVCTAATTMPAFAAAPAMTHAALASVAPKVCGSSLTGQTTPPTVNTALGTITGTAGHQFYAYVS